MFCLHLHGFCFSTFLFLLGVVLIPCHGVVKVQINAKEQIAINQQCLVWKGTRLENGGHKLFDYDVQDGATLHLFQRVEDKPMQIVAKLLTGKEIPLDVRLTLIYKLYVIQMTFIHLYTFMTH